MFRRLSDSLPKDPIYPANLKELGYFIDEAGQIRQIDNPSEFFQFYITNNHRHNDVHREAYHTCLRAEVIKRMTSMGIAPLYLPQLSTAKPSEPHTRILTTPPDQLRQKKRVYIIINEHYQELGILAYRVLSREPGIEAGSAICVVKELIRRSSDGMHNGVSDTEKERKSQNATTEASGSQDHDIPGIIILNPGELLYSHNRGMPLSATAWDALPRPSAVHPTTKVDPVHNMIEGNKNPQEHVAFVFDHIVSNPNFVNQEAKIYIIGLSDGGETVVQLLDQEWHKYQNRIAAIALTQPLHSPDTLTSAPFQEFLKHRCRSYILSAAPLNTILATPTQALPYDVNQNLPSSGTAATHQVQTNLPILPANSTNGTVTDDQDSTSQHGSDFSDEVNENGTVTRNNDVAVPWGASNPPPRPDQCVTNLTLSGAEERTVECIFPKAYKVILDFFDEVARDVEGYKNPEL